jgi:hypothetical protein
MHGEKKWEKFIGTSLRGLGFGGNFHFDYYTVLYALTLRVLENMNY